jgi:hypothetical protein
MVYWHYNNGAYIFLWQYISTTGPIHCSIFVIVFVLAFTMSLPLILDADCLLGLIMVLLIRPYNDRAAFISGPVFFTFMCIQLLAIQLISLLHIIALPLGPQCVLFLLLLRHILDAYYL